MDDVGSIISGISITLARCIEVGDGWNLGKDHTSRILVDLDGEWLLAAIRIGTFEITWEQEASTVEGIIILGTIALLLGEIEVISSSAVGIDHLEISNSRCIRNSSQGTISRLDTSTFSCLGSGIAVILDSAIILGKCNEITLCSIHTGGSIGIQGARIWDDALSSIWANSANTFRSVGLGQADIS